MRNIMTSNTFLIYHRSKFCLCYWLIPSRHALSYKSPLEQKEKKEKMDIMLTEISQTPKDKYCTIWLPSKKVKLTEAERRIVVAGTRGGRGGRKWEILVKVYKVSITRKISSVDLMYGITTIVKHAQLCLTLCDPTGCSLPGSSVHGILQARILEWVAMPSSRGSSPPWDQTWVSHVASRFFILWATREAQEYWSG